MNRSKSNKEYSVTIMELNKKLITERSLKNIQIWEMKEHTFK